MGTGKADGFQTVSTLGRASKKKGCPFFQGDFWSLWLVDWELILVLIHPQPCPRAGHDLRNSQSSLVPRTEKQETAFHSQRRQWHPSPVLLPGKSHGRRSLVGCSPWGREESDTTERLHFHFLLSRIGEGNGNPLQYSCLDNPRDRGAWWAAVYGVAQSRTRLKQLSSRSSSSWRSALDSKEIQSVHPKGIQS